MIRESTLETLECTSCQQKYDPSQKNRLCKCGKILFARYDLEKAKETIKDGTERIWNIWRYPEIMPVKKAKYRYTLGEGWTPLLKLHNTGKRLGLTNLFLKDEGQNPTGSFKSRGLCAAVSKARELGIEEFVIPTAGNAGVALAAYTSRAGAKAHVFMPEDTPVFIQKEVKAMGGDLQLVKGLITNASARAKEEGEKHGWFDVSTLKEPYRVEAKKTMGYEIGEQFRIKLNWKLPDVIVYPTGGGTGLIGMWKAFNEMEDLGLIGTERPRMISVQSSGCAPIVKAFEQKNKKVEPWVDAETIAFGLRVPSAIGDYLILQAIYDSKGTAIAVDDDAILVAMKELAKREGMMFAPEAAATYAATKLLKSSDEIDIDETIVLFATGSGLIYPDMW